MKEEAAAEQGTVEVFHSAPEESISVVSEPVRELLKKLTATAVAAPASEKLFRVTFLLDAVYAISHLPKDSGPLVELVYFVKTLQLPPWLLKLTQYRMGLFKMRRLLPANCDAKRDAGSLAEVLT